MKRKNIYKNIITWKIKYSCSDEDLSIILDYIKAYNPVLRYTYNRYVENPKIDTKELYELQKTINKSGLIKSYLMNCCIYDSKSLYGENGDKVIFGGRANFINRCQHKIDKETFQFNRLVPLYCVGESSKYGNRFFTIVDKNTIMFKPSSKTHINLTLSGLGRKRTKDIEQLIKLQNSKAIPITYKLSTEYIYVSFDYTKLKEYKYTTISNRVMGIDLNPNYLGWVVIDWLGENKYNIIKAGSFSLKPLNDYQKKCRKSSNDKVTTYINNKRKHEICEIAKQLFTICKHFKCETFSIEDLDMLPATKDKKTRNYRRLVNNQWCRKLFFNQIKKYINASSTLFLPIKPNYSSFVGNLLYRNTRLPDECLASIEISRRGFKFANQYIYKRQSQKKNIIFPSLELEDNKHQVALSLEELDVGVSNFEDNWAKLFSEIKKSKVKYRFSLEDAVKYYSSTLFSKNYKNRYIILNVFI